MEDYNSKKANKFETINTDISWEFNMLLYG